MKKSLGYLTGVILLFTLAVSGANTSASSAFVPQHVVVFGGGSRLFWVSWTESSSTTVRSNSGYLFRFCTDTTCSLATAVAEPHYRDNAPYREYLTTIGMPEELGSGETTVEVGHADLRESDMWSQPSRPITPVTPPQSPENPTLPQMQVGIAQQGSTDIQFGYCFNRRNDDDLMRSGTDLVFHAVRPTATYTLSSNGTVVESGSMGGADEAWFQLCEDSFLAPVRIDNLTTGTTYRIEIRFESMNHPTLVAYQDFTTAGGCPIEAPQYITPAIPWNHAVVDENNRFVHYLTAIFSKRYARNRGVAPAYTTPGKTFPSSSAYEYLPEIDDWALHLDEVSSIGRTELVKRTVFEDCAPEEVDMLVTTVTDSRSGEDFESACQVVDGVVIPTRIGECFLRIVASRRTPVTGFSVAPRSARSTQVLTVPFIIDSLDPSPPPSMPASSDSQPTRALPDAGSPSNAIGSPAGTAGSLPENPSRKSQTSGITRDLGPIGTSSMIRTVGDRISMSTLTKRSGIKPAPGSTSSIRIFRSSRKVCHLRDRRVVMAGPGTCQLNLVIRQARRRPFIRTLTIVSRPR